MTSKASDLGQQAGHEEGWSDLTLGRSYEADRGRVACRGGRSGERGCYHVLTVEVVLAMVRAESNLLGRMETGGIWDRRWWNLFSRGCRSTS